jgi:hypothetical protein
MYASVTLKENETDELVLYLGARIPIHDLKNLNNYFLCKLERKIRSVQINKTRYINSFQVTLLFLNIVRYLFNNRINIVVFVI